MSKEKMHIGEVNSDYLKCPDCNKTLDGIASEHGCKPKNNDISLCIYCGCVSKYVGEEEDELHLVKYTEEDFNELKNTDEDSYNHVMNIRRVILIKNK